MPDGGARGLAVIPAKQESVYCVVVYQEGCGELITNCVDVIDHPDPVMVRLVVDCHKPGE